MSSPPNRAAASTAVCDTSGNNALRRACFQITVRCTYDNSSANAGLMEALLQAGKPGPQDVGLGETALDEMCLGVITMIYKSP